MLGRGGGRRRQRSSEDEEEEEEEEGKERETDDELHRRLRHLSPPGPTPSGTFPHGPTQPGPLQPRLFPNSPPSLQAAAATQRTWCGTRDRGLSRLAWHSNTQRRRLQQLL